ncbi:multiple sugar transport system permease protein [Thermosporothrix hazakensis]|uniref:Multiple sugar transport system permease protein n=2 Tax=Thermosporothrix TaxID=768650 RepID=A0A326U4H7_THEHA|nr:carbohydrate ABC transporter permease [Thermosporothrix hazakensis]PZW27948.1 multiple sugar transport system permease protein [Thermosporothrix hazakensis]BBH86876.1 ABC transporter permease [Thermosporothrix sp. COM3]GCE51172.1 ABC transporter permease [Thermosporothrix hazakensis]
MKAVQQLSPRKIWGQTLAQLVLIAGSIFMAFPLVYQLVASFCTQQAFLHSGWFPIPDSLYLGNYVQAFVALQTGNLLVWIFNTLVRIVWYILVPGVVAVLGGYIFSRLQWRGREAMFVVLLASMIVPSIVYMLPQYLLLARWPLAGGNDIVGQGGHGFINDWPALLLPNLVNAYYIFLLRQTFYSIPSDYEDAARVDGANTLQVLWHVYLPMLKPALTVLVIFQSMHIWNDYIWPLATVGGNADLWTISVGVQRAMTMVSDEHSHMLNYPLAFTLATLTTIPIVLLFLFLQRYFKEGVQGMGLKG